MTDRPGRALCRIAALIAAVAASPAAAQSPPARWSVDGGYTTYRVTGQNGWGHGPEATIRRHFSDRLAGEFDLAVLLHSTGFYDFSGVGGGLGIAWSTGPSRLTGTLAAGIAALLGSDSDGSFQAFAGPYASAEASAWITGHTGIFVRTTGRLWQTLDDYGPALTAGLALRF